MQPESPLSRTQGGEDRGQSVFDYTIGVSLFLVVVLGVLVFVPTAFGSFGGETAGGANDELVAERGADYLAGTALSGPERASTFRAGCLVLFFDGTTSNADVAFEPSECGLEPGEPLPMNLSLSPGQPVNVTVERNVTGDADREILCWNHRSDDPSNVTSIGHGECGTSADDVELRAGSSVADNEQFAAAERYGTVAGTGVYVVVRTW